MNSDEERAEVVDLSKSVRRKTGRKLDFFIIAVLLLSAKKSRRFTASYL
jgi:hypothetical protein